MGITAKIIAVALIDLTIIYRYLFSGIIRPSLLFAWILNWAYVLNSYILAVHTLPGIVTNDIETEKFNTFCSRCEKYRPARAHHCRKCKKCILRFDHHCYWLDNCIGFYNQGHFVRLLVSAGAGFLLTLYLLFSVLYERIFSKSLDAFQIFLIILNCVMMLPTTMTILMLTFNQLKLVYCNLTTVEEMERQDDLDLDIPSINPYDMGWLENTKQILGTDPIYWIIPKKMHGNGVDFKHINPYDL